MADLDRDVERCGFLCVHEDTVDQVLGQMPHDEQLYDLAELFKVFGDSTRIKILYALFEAELCVCDIAQLLGLTQSAVSHQLRVLKANRLVKPQEGRQDRLLLPGGRSCAQDRRPGHGTH